MDVVKTEPRMVAIIYPAGSWGVQDDPDERRRLAQEDEIHHPRFGLVLCIVAPPRGEPNKRMVSKIIHQPDDQPPLEWTEYLSQLVQAMVKPILYYTDFDQQPVW